MTQRRRRVERPSATGLAAVFGPQGVLRTALPEFEDRKAQREMAEAVERAILNGQTLLAEAGTGTGKTLAYLAPALLHAAKTVVATGTKTLQEQLFFKDIPLLASALSRKFRTSLMKGRANYLCRRNLRRALGENHTRPGRQALLKIQRWSATSPRGDRAELDFLSENDPLWDDIAAWSESCLGTACEDYDECFLTRMRQEAAAADLVIVNHHLLLADAVLWDSSQFQIIPAYDVLVLDEAHLLEDIATDFFGVEISNLRVERLVRDTNREWTIAAQSDRSIPAHLGRVTESCARFFRMLDFPEGTRRLRPGALEGPCESGGRQLIEDLTLLHDLVHAIKEKPEGLVACARRAREQAAILRGFFDQPASTQDPPEDAPVLSPVEGPVPSRVEGLVMSPVEGPVLSPVEGPVVRWAERRGRGVFLRSSPLDVSADFRRTILHSAKSIILTSATLSAAGRFDFLRNRLGIEEAQEFRAASPFHYESQAILYIPRHLPDPRNPGFIQAAAAEVQAILEITQGRALVLFTSLEAMETTHRLLDGRLSFPLMVQGQAPRTQLLDRFREEVESVLLATRSFWQGVDIVGEALSCVIVHKLPFGFPGEPVLEARLEYIQQRGGDPFWDYQIPSAIITLRQGLGRLIRSAEDRGALCILDNRLLSRGYGGRFLESLPPCPVTTAREDLRRFFGTG